MKQISKTKWFRELQAVARAFSKVNGVAYPNDDPTVNARIHGEAERMIGRRLAKVYRRELGT